MKVLSIMVGGALGALARYNVSILVSRISQKSFPLGTLSVNLIGCALIGVVFAVTEKFIIPSNVRTFIFIGFLGAFTTFSTFAIETMHLLREREIKLALLNILTNNILGILLVFTGFILTSYFLKVIK